MNGVVDSQMDGVKFANFRISSLNWSRIKPLTVRPYRAVQEGDLNRKVVYTVRGLTLLKRPGLGEPRIVIVL